MPASDGWPWRCRFPLDTTSTTAPLVPLSVLDLAPVPAGSTAAEALANSVELARHVERLGYTRHWVAEHHNMAGIASSSPPVLIAHLANATTTLRVGAGGVMLPNHAALTVAEQFGTLEAFHPGRIDLGLGRAPGTDQVTAAALRRNTREAGDEFPSQLGDLLAYFGGTHPQIIAATANGYRPAIWLLGSSDYSAHAAGVLGLPFSFAHHFASGGTAQALDVYRESFRPSQWLEQPYSMIGVPVICAADSDEATYLSGPSALSFLNLRQGKPVQMPSPAEAALARVHPDGTRDRAQLARPVGARRPERGSHEARGPGRSLPSRRVDAHHDGARPGRPAALVRAGRRGMGAARPPRATLLRTVRRATATRPTG